jgi:hypothetical protein
MAETKWRPVPGYPDIEVSEDLQFRTIERTVAYVRPTGTVSHRTFPSRKLKVQWLHKDGYATVFVSRLRRPIGCHVLVCLAWHGLPSKGRYYVLHRDGDSGNFSPENLYWGDHVDNAKDAIDHGVMARGEKHGLAKLNDDAVNYIRANCVKGDPERGLASLGRLFSVSPVTIRHVVDHSTWAHV